MAVISIVGTSGVGKSFLVKQLASYDCSPAFFEGEEGTIPKEIFKDIFGKKEPLKRWKWFLNRYSTTMKRARKISDVGLNCYVDSEGHLVSYAILPTEPKDIQNKLEKLILPFKNMQPDKILVLSATKETLLKFFKARARSSEQRGEAIKRAMKLQEELIRLAKKQKLTVVIERDDLDFSKEEDIKLVVDLLFSPAHEGEWK